MSETRSSCGKRLSAPLTGRDGVREPAQWHERILEGLPASALESVKTRALLTDTEIARLLGIGEATLRRARASGAPLDPATGDRLYRFSKILTLASDVLESEKNAAAWLRRSQPALSGQVPLELLVTQAGADEVEALLGRIEYSVYT